MRSFYPFLDGDMLAHGFSLDWEQKCEGAKDKVLLKKLLQASVPGILEERPKRGFSPPYERLLRRDDVQERMRSALFDRLAPLRGCYRADFLRKALDRGHRGVAPNRGLMNLLWSAFFASSWIRQVYGRLSPTESAPAG